MSSRSVSNHVRARIVRASGRLSLIKPPSSVKDMAGPPSPSGMQCHRADGGGFEIATNAAFSRENFESRESHKDDIRALFSGRGKFQPSFFLPLFGPGKIPGEA